MTSDADSGTEQASTPSTVHRASVVEDEALIRLDIVGTLEEAGFEVIGQTGDNGKTIELAAEFDPDLVATDVKMPGMNGATAVEKILAAKRCAVVMLTAFSQSELVERTRDAGAMAYVVKPFTPADLIPAVEIALSRNQEVLALKNEVSNLAKQFGTHRRIDRVKGLLKAETGLSKPEAFRWIQKASMGRQLTMREVADAVIEQVDGRG